MIDEAILDPEAGDRSQLVDALALAFRDNPMNRVIHGPNSGRRERANRAGLRSLVLDATSDAVTRVIRHEGRIVGGFVVVPPGRFPLPPPRLRRLMGCLLHQGSRAMDQWGQVTSALLPHHPFDGHWYLAALGVVPSLHGLGFGSRLLSALFRLVEHDPGPLYLESDREASMRFYRGRGFRLVHELELLGLPCWCLQREIPGGAGDLCDSVREGQ
jgi:ribosomal protein S18 acetylase RimI-like enzyme